EGRVEADHKAIGALHGTVGFQLSDRNFEAVGEEESFLQPTRTFSAAGFLLEELDQGSFTHQLGLRSELVKVEPSALGFNSRGFAPLSGALGTVWRFKPGYSAGASLS